MEEGKRKGHPIGAMDGPVRLNGRLLHIAAGGHANVTDGRNTHAIGSTMPRIAVALHTAPSGSVSVARLTR